MRTEAAEEVGWSGRKQGLCWVRSRTDSGSVSAQRKLVVSSWHQQIGMLSNHGLESEQELKLEELKKKRKKEKKSSMLS